MIVQIFLNRIVVSWSSWCMCSRIRGFLFADLAYVVEWFSEFVLLLILERYRGSSVFVRIACPTARKILRIIRQFAFRCNCESFDNIRG